MYKKIFQSNVCENRRKKICLHGRRIAGRIQDRPWVRHFCVRHEPSSDVRNLTARGVALQPRGSQEILMTLFRISRMIHCTVVWHCWNMSEIHYFPSSKFVTDGNGQDNSGALISQPWLLEIHLFIVIKDCCVEFSKITRCSLAQWARLSLLQVFDHDLDPKFCKISVASKKVKNGSFAKIVLLPNFCKFFSIFCKFSPIFFQFQAKHSKFFKS